MRRITLLFVLLHLSFATPFWAQTFQNLDFELANVSNLPPNQFEIISTTNGLPGWTAYIGANQQTQVSHNGITLGAANVGVFGPDYALGLHAIEGIYSAILQDGGTPDQGAQPASIAQTGEIPAWANSLRFEGTLSFGSATFKDNVAVSINGQNIPVVQIGGNVYGCDVSAFTNSVNELSFSMVTNYGNALILLDNISFSPQSIPEPTVLDLSAMGMVMVVFLYSIRRKAI